jgi:hypothetical protein
VKAVLNMGCSLLLKRAIHCAEVADVKGVYLECLSATLEAPYASGLVTAR